MTTAPTREQYEAYLRWDRRSEPLSETEIQGRLRHFDIEAERINNPPRRRKGQYKITNPPNLALPLEDEIKRQIDKYIEVKWLKYKKLLTFLGQDPPIPFLEEFANTFLDQKELLRSVFIPGHTPKKFHMSSQSAAIQQWYNGVLVFRTQTEEDKTTSKQYYFIDRSKYRDMIRLYGIARGRNEVSDLHSVYPNTKEKAYEIYSRSPIKAATIAEDGKIKGVHSAPESIRKSLVGDPVTKKTFMARLNYTGMQSDELITMILKTPKAREYVGEKLRSLIRESINSPVIS